MGSVAHQITLGCHRIGILMPCVKQAGFVLERDYHPDQRAECLLSHQSSRTSPSNLGVFGLDKRATQQMKQVAAMQQQTRLWQLDGLANAVAHTACVHYDCCTGQHKMTNKGTRAAQCRDLAYQRCHLDVCRSRPGALVSDGRALSRLQHSSDLLPWKKSWGWFWFLVFAGNI